MNMELPGRTINSFVFFDVETSDLIRGRKMPKITELAMVAVAREHLIISKNKLPRVLSKLVIPISTNDQISQKVTEFTRLSNKNLEKAKPFNSGVFYSVLHFLGRLEPPICFAAHNGKLFDYPIFLKEIQEINKSISEDILSIDTLEFFKCYFRNKRSEIKRVLKNNQMKNGSVTKYDNLMKDSWDDAVCRALDLIETFPSFDEGIELDKGDKDYENLISSQEVIENFPDSQNMEQNSSPSSSTCSNIEKPSVPKNFKLETLHTHMIGCAAENLHNAENDCLVLLELANLVGIEFSEFADAHAIPLTSYERNCDW